MKPEEKNNKEHVLVGLSSAPSNGKIIETAAKMAEAFQATFTALYIKTSHSEHMSEDDQKRLQNNVKLAERLGATIITVYGEDVPLQIAEYAKLSGVTKIVVGRSVAKKNGLINKPTLTDKLIELAPNMDIYIIPDVDSKIREQRISVLKRTNLLSVLKDLCISVLIIAIASLIGLFFAYLGFSESNIITLYILGVLITSVVTNSKTAWWFSSIASVLVFNFLFTKPRFTLLAYGDGYPITFAIMIVASLITGSLASKMLNQAKQSTQAAYRTKILFDTNQLLQRAQDNGEIFHITAKQIKKMLDRDVVVFLPDDAEHSPIVCSKESDFQIRDRERNVAQNIAKDPSYDYQADQEQCTFYPIRSHDRIYGVLAVYRGDKVLDPFEHDIVLSIVGECALALENSYNAKEKEFAAILAKNEQLRSNLLRAISHDLRTPLTAISGNASNLITNGKAFDEETKTSIYHDIYDDSMWLIDLVENLLSITRLEEGKINIDFTAELVDEVVAEALKHVHRKDGGHTITVVQKDELLLAKMDARLIVQVVVNLVDNAIKYTPSGSEIVISSERRGDMAIVSIADNGYGISDEQKSRVFDMFYTGANQIADSRRSLGLGLALCRSIVSAHGGEITVTDNVPHGAVFTFTLPVGEVEIHE